MNIMSFNTLYTSIVKQPWHKLAALFITSMALTVNATDFSLNVHQGDQSDVKGFSFYVADNFTNKSNFYWHVGYSNYQDLPVKWNNDELYFDVSNIEAIVSYRQKLRSYNKFVNSLSVEYILGAAVVMTENKFTWPELKEAKFFSEKGDVNPLVGVALHYNFTRNTALVFGVKYQPEVSEFGDLSSIYVGVNHRFGKISY